MVHAFTVTQSALRSMRRATSLLFPWGIAMLTVALATVVRLAAGRWLADPSLLFLAAVSLIAWRWGTGPSVFAVALSALAQARYFIAPDAFLLATAEQAVALGVWFAEAVLVCA